MEKVVKSHIYCRLPWHSGRVCLKVLLTPPQSHQDGLGLVCQRQVRKYPPPSPPAGITRHSRSRNPVLPFAEQTLTRAFRSASRAGHTGQVKWTRAGAGRQLLPRPNDRPDSFVGHYRVLCRLYSLLAGLASHRVAIRLHLAGYPALSSPVFWKPLPPAETTRAAKRERLVLPGALGAGAGTFCNNGAAYGPGPRPISPVSRGV